RSGEGASRAIQPSPTTMQLAEVESGNPTLAGYRVEVVPPLSDDYPERVPQRALRIELVIVLGVTFGISAVSAILQLADAVLRNLSAQRIPLNPRRSYFDFIDLGLNATLVVQSIAWGALGLYLLWRSGLSPARIGLARFGWRTDLVAGIGLAALIGLPGL